MTNAWVKHLFKMQARLTDFNVTEFEKLFDLKFYTVANLSETVRI